MNFTLSITLDSVSYTHLDVYKRQIKAAMVRIYQRFQSENITSKMILQVHDELNVSVLPEEKEKVQKIVIEEMENAYHMQVPLRADCGWGSNWLEAH